ENASRRRDRFPTSPPRICSATSFTFHFPAAVGRPHSCWSSPFSSDSNSRRTGPNRCPVRIGCKSRNVFLSVLSLVSKPSLCLRGTPQAHQDLRHPLEVLRFHQHRPQPGPLFMAAFRPESLPKPYRQFCDRQVQTFPRRGRKDPPRTRGNFRERITARRKAHNVELRSKGGVESFPAFNSFPEL